MININHSLKNHKKDLKGMCTLKKVQNQKEDFVLTIIVLKQFLKRRFFYE